MAGTGTDEAGTWPPRDKTAWPDPQLSSPRTRNDPTRLRGRGPFVWVRYVRTNPFKATRVPTSPKRRAISVENLPDAVKSAALLTFRQHQMRACGNGTPHVSWARATLPDCCRPVVRPSVLGRHDPLAVVADPRGTPVRDDARMGQTQPLHSLRRRGVARRQRPASQPSGRKPAVENHRRHRDRRPLRRSGRDAPTAHTGAQRRRSLRLDCGFPRGGCRSHTLPAHL